jgi:hypothetical protein
MIVSVDAVTRPGEIPEEERIRNRAVQRLR